MNSKQTPQVIVTKCPPTVTYVGDFGGGFRRHSAEEDLVDHVCSALVYGGYGHPDRKIKLVAPDDIRDAVQARGFDV